MAIAEVMIWNPIERILWGVIITILVISAAIYFFRGKGKESFNEKIIMYGFASLLFCFAMDRTFAYIAEFYIPGEFDGFTFNGNYDLVGTEYELLIRAVAIINTIGFMLFYLTFELIFKKTKFLITVLQGFFLYYILTRPFEYARWFFSNIIFITNGFLFILILFNFAKWSRLEFKSVSSLLMFGYLLIGQGINLSGRPVKAFNVVPLTIPAVIYLLGVLFMIFPIIVDPKYLSQGLKYWLIIGASALGLVVFLEFYYFIYGFEWFYTLTGFMMILFFLYLFYSSIKIIKSEAVHEDKDKTKRDILGIFTRPKKVTEEEISISKEKQICLVCKNEIARQNYICPDCKAFYCIKCSSTLAILENICWVCETPFDSTKPVKKQEIEKKDTSIDAEEQKTLHKGKTP